jgi:hypothetical protein
MGLGSTAKNVQKLADLAEKLYKQVNEVLKRVGSLQDDVQEATDDVQAVRREQREQRAILEALADEQGVDVDGVLEAADLDLPDAEDAAAGGEDVADDEDASDGKDARSGDDEDADSEEPPATTDTS